MDVINVMLRLPYVLALDKWEIVPNIKKKIWWWIELCINSIGRELQ